MYVQIIGLFKSRKVGFMSIVKKNLELKGNQNKTIGVYPGVKSHLRRENFKLHYQEANSLSFYMMQDSFCFTASLSIHIRGIRIVV